MPPTDMDSFIRAQTAVASPPLVPEIALHLATEITPLWQATEAWLEREGIEPPYWAFAWAGGQALARHLLDRPETVAGKRVLDFGAGSGLVALAAAQAGAVVEAAELDAMAVSVIRLNAALNNLAVTVITGDVIGRDGGWDVVLAGDMFYERKLAVAALPWLRGLVARGALVLLGDPGRAYLPESGLTEVARYTVPTTRELEDRETREGRIWRLSA
ncbi:MAG: 50S ribosomal protein L11 methyltransferase [Alphaproteobacteria bacterium]|nr:50S ribosomal protein L11 methyltransferase [Alphaproteobacteria bacterium]